MLETTQGHLGGYVVGGPDARTICKELWSFFLTELGCNSALDIGCGLGYTVEMWRLLGFRRVRGIDGSAEAIKGKEDLLLHDYTKGPLTSNPFDLVWSAEFVEHVEEQYMPNFMETIASAAPYYLAMTHAVPGQAGHHHVNCQPSSYWIEAVQQHAGMRYCKHLTKLCRELAMAKIGEGYFFYQTGLVFCR